MVVPRPEAGSGPVALGGTRSVFAREAATGLGTVRAEVAVAASTQASGSPSEMGQGTH